MASGRILSSGVLAAQQIHRGLAAGMQQAIPVVGAAMVRADDRGQRLAVLGRQLRRPQLHLVGVEVSFGRPGHTQSLGQQRADALRERLGVVGITPGIPLHRR